MSTQVDRRVRQEWWTSAFETFPFTMFSGVQSFTLYQNFTDFIGGVVEFPIALIQLYLSLNSAPTTQSLGTPTAGLPEQVKSSP
jgi:hypothetical protein